MEPYKECIDLFFISRSRWGALSEASAVAMAPWLPARLCFSNCMSALQFDMRHSLPNMRPCHLLLQHDEQLAENFVKRDLEVQHLLKLMASVVTSPPQDGDGDGDGGKAASSAGGGEGDGIDATADDAASFWQAFQDSYYACVTSPGSHHHDVGSSSSTDDLGMHLACMSAPDSEVIPNTTSICFVSLRYFVLGM